MASESADTMRAVVVREPGGVDVLEVQTRDVPEPGPGQLTVDVAASGVNFIDVYRRIGRYPVPTPFVLGGECAGRVRAVGDGMTAHYLVHSTYPVQAGDHVLVHAAAGGVGALLVQMATSLGASVIATVGSARKVEIARAAGAREVIRYDEVDDVAAAVRKIVPGGLDAVYDGVGAATFEGSLRSLRPRGMLALFGAASGPVPPFDLQRLNPLGSLFVTRPTMGHYVATPEELRWRSGDVLGDVASGALHIAIGGRYPLDAAAQVYRDLEGRATTGKLLIVP
jgi:NADPH2:quinone reductase